MALHFYPLHVSRKQIPSITEVVVPLPGMLILIKIQKLVHLHIYCSRMDAHEHGTLELVQSEKT